MQTLRVLTLFGAVCSPFMFYSTPAAALECTFGAAPFYFISAEPVAGSITSDIIRNTPLYGVIPEVGDTVSRQHLEVVDSNCDKRNDSMLLPVANLVMPPVIRTISHNGYTYDVYATNQPWAGYIVTKNGSEEPIKDGGLLKLFTAWSTKPDINLSLGVQFVKLADPLNGTVGQLYIWLKPQGFSFDIGLPDGRYVNVKADFDAASVDVLGVVCNLDAPAELDFGDVAIGDLKQPGTLAAVNLALGINCGSGYEMVDQRIPDSMRVQFMGGTDPGLLDSDQSKAVAGAECNTVIELKLEHHAA